MEKPTTPELRIQRIKHIAPDADGQQIVVRADALLEDERTELEIAVTTELAPEIALALLSSTAHARAKRDDLDPALDVLAAAVVRSSSKDRVRLHLLFNKGLVLPFELTLDACRALSAGLEEYLDSPAPRYAESRRQPAPIGQVMPEPKAQPTATQACPKV